MINNYTNLAAAAAAAAAAATTTTTTTLLKMPRIGLGTLGLMPSEALSVINQALSLGYRAFDCAPVYFNEKEIGDAFHEATSGVPRSDVFVTSKLAGPFHRPEHVEPALRKTLHDLRLGYLDLFLIHWPVAFQYVDFDPSERGWPNEDIDNSDNGKLIDPTVSIRDTWTAMEKLVDDGLVKHIGVANFPVILLHDMLSYARIPPAVNQVEIHPYNQQTQLLEFCHSHNIVVQAYSPLGSPGYKESREPEVLSDPILKEIANNHEISVAQLCILWSLQRGCHLIAKSSNAQHMEENLVVHHRYEFAESTATTCEDDVPATATSGGTTTTLAARKAASLLSSEEMERIASLDRGYRYFRPEDWWRENPVPVFH